MKNLQLFRERLSLENVFWTFNSLRASSPIWASEASLSRTRERRTSLARFCEAHFACPNRRACSRAKPSKSFWSEQNFPPKIVEHPIDSQVLDRTFLPASKLSIWGISWKVDAREAREKRRESGGWGRERPFLSHSRGSIGELARMLRTA